jgi:type IV secretion system protein TrbF
MKPMKELQKEKAVNHYLAGKQAWAEQYGTYIRSRDIWRKVAMGALAVAILACVGNIIQLSQSKIIPYVIEVDKLGKIRGAGPATPTTVIPQAVMQGALAEFVTNWRTVTADIGLQKKLLTQASYQVAGSARGTLREFFAENNPYERGQKSLVEVRIQGVPMPISEGGHSWQVEWREIRRTRAGVKEHEAVYQASLQIQIKAPDTDAEILNNPSGVYITALSWTKKFQ